MHGTTSRVLSLLAAAALGLTACGDSGDPSADAGGVSTVASSVPPTTASPLIDPSTTTPPTTEPPEAATTTADVAASEVSNDELAAQIEGVLANAIAPGSIAWDAGGVDTPPTAAVAAVRIPGRDDVLVAVGDNVDGSAAQADAPFSVAHLTESLVRTVAFQLIDEGVLDSAETVDQWVPTLPNADRVTVQMVIENKTGWSDYGLIEPDPEISDFGRAWSLREAVELRATAMTALGEPGTPSDDGHTNEAVLGLVVQEVGGEPLADLIRDRVAAPEGLGETDLLDGTNVPGDYRHGVFVFNGAAADTSAFDGTSYTTWNHATHSAVSTPTDLLDLLDAWATGALFTTDRTPAPQRYAPEPVRDEDGNPSLIVGADVPFNGFCPCTEVDGGFEPTAFGRAPATIGTLTFLLRYADGISVVVNVNSNEADPADIRGVTNAVHDLAAASA